MSQTADTQPVTNFVAFAVSVYIYFWVATTEGAPSWVNYILGLVFVLLLLLSKEEAECELSRVTKILSRKEHQLLEARNEVEQAEAEAENEISRVTKTLSRKEQQLLEARNEVEQAEAEAEYELSRVTNILSRKEQQLLEARNKVEQIIDELEKFTGILNSSKIVEINGHFFKPVKTCRVGDFSGGKSFNIPDTYTHLTTIQRLLEN